jgi:hypothetical protein
MKMRDFWDIAPCSLVGLGRRFRGFITLIVEVYAPLKRQSTRCYIPDGSHLLTRRLEKLKSHKRRHVHEIDTYMKVKI